MSQSEAERSAAYRAKKQAAGEVLPSAWARIQAKSPAEREVLLQRGREALTKRRQPRRATSRPFMAVDGEGAGLDAEGIKVAGELLHRQQYRLLRIGPDELYSGEPLTSVECLEHILAAPANRVLVGYAFGYDTTMILVDLPPNRRDRLLRTGPYKEAVTGPTAGDAPWIGRYTYWNPAGFTRGGYALEYLPRNYFRVARTESYTSAKGRISRRVIKGTTRTVYDVFAFFQCSFVKALRSWQVGTPQQQDDIEADKQRRDSFLAITDRERAYCQLECELLEQLMDKFRAVCQAADIVPAQWSGAGKLSAALHKQHGTITAAQLIKQVPEAVRDMAQQAYFGGRFEVMRTGRITGDGGPVHSYDIKSAYPAQMAHRLPCLLHGTWEELTPRQCVKRFESQNDREPFVARVKFTHRPPPHIRHMNLCGLPVRTREGRLIWPIEASGVYWSPEVRAALAHGCEPRFGRGWGYVGHCDCRPFSWVQQLYDYRQSLGDDGRGTVIKLGSNGLYGKLAQRVGNPRYANMVWASLITAFTRAQLLDAAAFDPEAIVMFATDGIYSRRKLPLDIGKGLGQWDHTTHSSIFVVQPGLYWGPIPDNMKEWQAKSRGIAPGYFASTDDRGQPRARAFEQAWSEYARDYHSARRPDDLYPPEVELRLRLFIGLRLAQARGKPGLAGVWHDRPHKVKFDWSAKRIPGSPLVWETPQSVWHYPPMGGPKVWSRPHSTHRAMTEDELLREELADMPDHLHIGPEWLE